MERIAGIEFLEKRSSLVKLHDVAGQQGTPAGFFEGEITHHGLGVSGLVALLGMIKFLTNDAL